jgi:glutamine amidotransferase
MLKRLSIPGRLVEGPDDFGGVERILLPGVGAFDAGMTNLVRHGFVDVLNDLVLNKRVPVLGICLGMQMLARGSEEGRLPGLGWIKGDVIGFRNDPSARPRLKIPHMGWNEVTPRPESPLFRGFEGHPRFYFVHSYHFVCDAGEDVSGTVDYGGVVSAAVSSGNIHGVQFHPEKSHRFGMKLLENFCAL